MICGISVLGEDRILVPLILCPSFVCYFYFQHLDIGYAALVFWEENILIFAIPVPLSYSFLSLDLNVGCAASMFWGLIP